MPYVEVQPSAGAGRWVEAFWFLTDGLDGAEASVGGPPAAPVLPDGRGEIVFHLGAPFAEVLADGRRLPRPEAVAVGQIEGPMWLSAAGSVDLVGLRLRPGAVGPFLGPPAREITCRAEALADAVGPAAGQPSRVASVSQALHDAHGLAGRVAILEDWVRERSRRIVAPDPRVAAAVRGIDASGGTRVVAEVARRAGLGLRHLERLFVRDVGVGPKRLARITRFRRALAGLQGGADPVRVAAACGYADQSHLVREFREMAGDPPGAFLEGPPRFTDAFMDG